MFASPLYTSPSQHGPYANMGRSDYSTPYYLGHSYPFSYGESSPHIPPTRLPDLYYDYGLETSPSASSSEMIPTPPSFQTPLPLTDLTVPAYPRTMACQPNTATGSEIYDEYPAMGEGSALPVLQHSAKRQETRPHPTPHPHEALDFPLTTCFVSPLDTLLDPWVPNHTTSPLPLQSPPKLHQPRPSRRIPIVNLNELAACETSHHSLQGGDHIRSDSYPRHVPYQWPKQPSARRICEPIVTQGLREERVLSCFCGCMESYRLQ